MVIEWRWVIVRCLMNSELIQKSLLEKAETLRANGQTIMFVIVDEKPVGLIGVADPIKETTPTQSNNFTRKAFAS